VAHSRDVEDCGGTPRSLKPAKIPCITMWQYWLGNVKSFQIDPQKVASGFLKKFIERNFL